MLFINETGNKIKARVENERNASGYDWKTLGKGDKIDLPSDYGKALGLTALEKASEEQEATEGEQDAEGSEVTLEGREAFYDEMLQVQGVGPKTAEDILRIYRTKEELLSDLKSGREVPIRNDLAERIEKKMG